MGPTAPAGSILPPPLPAAPGPHRDGCALAAGERRSAVRRRVDEDGLIAVDEHTALPCMVYDLSSDGVRIVALDTGAVPQTFLLSSRRFAEGRVCSVVWRTAEEIGARFTQG